LAPDALFFIDANKFLDLFRTDKGKKLLSPLVEQMPYIFVTKQIVNEVQRNKVLVTAEFLRQKFTALRFQTFNVPDHLSNAAVSKEILDGMSAIFGEVKLLGSKVDSLAISLITEVSRSEDEVSKALTTIFENAVQHSQEELERARDRRELGNPPGKIANALGDQLTWEQILTHFKGKKRLWIISRDGDYGTTYEGKSFLNRFLFDELCQISTEPEVFLFQDLSEGIQHFVKTTGVKADKRLSPEEEAEIEQEEKSLPVLETAIDSNIPLTRHPLIGQFRKALLDSANEASIASSAMSDVLLNQHKWAQSLADSMPKESLANFVTMDRDSVNLLKDWKSNVSILEATDNLSKHAASMNLLKAADEQAAILATLKKQASSPSVMQYLTEQSSQAEALMKSVASLNWLKAAQEQVSMAEILKNQMLSIATSSSQAAQSITKILKEAGPKAESHSENTSIEQGPLPEQT